MKEKVREELQRISDEFHVYAGLQFAIYDYDLFENCKMEKNFAPDLVKKMHEISTAYFNGCGGAEAAEEIEQIRKTVIQRMEAVGAYSDLLSVFEYVFHRMEYSFEQMTEEERAKFSFDDDEEARNILVRIFAGSDASLINHRIQLTVSQLPVRMTKVKFLDLVDDSLSMYEGAETSTVEKFVYLVRSAAGLYRPEAMDEFTDLKEATDRFLAANYKELGQEEFDSLYSEYESMTAAIDSMSAFYVCLQDAVNQLSVLLLTKDYAGTEAHAKSERLRDISLWIAANEESAEVEMPDELLTLFTKAEGELERIASFTETAEGKLSAYRNKTNGVFAEEEIRKWITVLLGCSRLFSSSLFMDVFGKDDESTVGKEEIEQISERLREEFSTATEGTSSRLNRARMACVLGSLPVFFSSRNEIMEYVRYSLSNCRDVFEKTAAVELLEEAFDEIDG